MDIVILVIVGLVVLWLFASVKVVRQGYQYTIEYFGRFTDDRAARPEFLPAPSSIASAAR